MTAAWRPRALSATAIDTYLVCPASFYWAYVEQIPMPKTAAMWLGTAVHKAVERFHADPAADIQAEYSKVWKFCTQEMDRTAVPYAADLKREGAQLVALYEADPAPDGTPEVSFIADIPGLPVPLHGYIDLDGSDWLHELKTARYPWGEDRIANHRQVALYVAAKRAMTGSLPRAAILTVLSRYPSPGLARVVLRPTHEQADRAIEAARAVYGAIVGGIFDQRCRKGECRYPDRCEGRAGELEARQRDESRPRLTAGGVEVG